MALHRDIHWLGKRWAVTGVGLQTIDQRLKGQFDIAVVRLWDDDPAASLAELPWFDAEDFDKGLQVARRLYPQPHEIAAAPEIPPVEAPKVTAVAREEPNTDTPPALLEKLALHVGHWPSKLAPTWRVRYRKT